ncbi:MAG TPA: glycosyltransferase [Blastocatellia bacterium]|nr:glycosyltransferase [Blastocatellia bacterium]
MAKYAVMTATKMDSDKSKKIVLATFGSFGDIHPYMALALELKARGHRAVFATSDVYREKMVGAGLEFHALRPDLPRPETPQASEMVAKVMDTRRGAEFLLKEMFLPPIRETYEDTLAVAKGADLLISHPLTFTVPLVGEKFGIPWISTVLAPASLFSATDPSIMPHPAWLGPLLRASGPAVNRFFFAVLRKVTEPWFRPLTRLREDLGLPYRGHPLFSGQHSSKMVLALFSRVMGEPQPDWPPNTHVTGFPFYDKKDEAPISPEISKFLDAGPAPIVFTLGTSAVFIAGEFYRESIKAAKALGRRAMLLIGDARNTPKEPLPDGIAAFDYAPYGQVFARACAIVHQGGVGTTGQALRSGKPTIVVPFNHDQPDNAARVARAGTSRTVARTKYKADFVAAELDKLLSNPTYSVRSAEVGKVVEAENGASTACDLMEQLLESGTQREAELLIRT